MMLEMVPASVTLMVTMMMTMITMMTMVMYITLVTLMMMRRRGSRTWNQMWAAARLRVFCTRPRNPPWL